MILWKSESTSKSNAISILNIEFVFNPTHRVNFKPEVFID